MCCHRGEDAWCVANYPHESSRRSTKDGSGVGCDSFVAERGQEGIAKVREILGGGADAALECVGTRRLLSRR